MRIVVYLITALGNFSPTLANCTDTKAFNLFYGEHRQMAYDIIGENTNKKKITITLEKLNTQLSGEKIPEWEFTDQVHRVLTTALVNSEGQAITSAKKQELFTAALKKSYEFNLNYAQKN